MQAGEVRVCWAKFKKKTTKFLGTRFFKKKKQPNFWAHIFSTKKKNQISGHTFSPPQKKQPNFWAHIFSPKKKTTKFLGTHFFHKKKIESYSVWKF